MSKRQEWLRFVLAVAAAICVCGFLIWKPNIGAPIAALLIASASLVIAATGKPKGSPFMLSERLLYRLPEAWFRVVYACMGVVILALGLWGLFDALG